MDKTMLKRPSDNKATRWLAMLIVSFTMMCGYFLTDVMNPLENLLTTEGKMVYFSDDTSIPMIQLKQKVEQSTKGYVFDPATVQAGSEVSYFEEVDGAAVEQHKIVDKVLDGKGWSSSDYGFFAGSYGYINVFLLMLFFGGIILDKMGIRFTGIMSSGLMFVGALIKWYSLVGDFGSATLFGHSMQVMVAALGFAIFGVGCEITGITTSKIIVKWFTGKELALAMGVQVGLARIGTALAMAASFPVAKMMGGVSYPILMGAIVLCIGFLSFLVYTVLDKKEDRAVADARVEAGESGDEEGFRFGDLKFIFTNKGFWLITLLCLMFYSGVFPFLKFAAKLMIYKYNVPENFAGFIPALLPFGTILLTPIFGTLYDRIGKGATLMVIGSVMLTVVHVLFALPLMNVWWFAVIVMIVLGVAFSLVPSAMWPSVPKIIPMRQLGSAYAIIFYIQNIGLSLVPLLIGTVIDRYATLRDANGVVTGYDYTFPMMIFSIFGFCAIVIALLLRMEDGRKNYGLEKANIQK